MKIYGLILIVISVIGLIGGLEDAIKAKERGDRIGIMLVGALFVAYIVYILVTMSYGY